MQARYAIILFGAVFLLSSCMVGPRYTRPCLPIQSEWVEQLDDGCCSHIFENPMWWTDFNEPALNELIEYSFIQNQDLEISGIRVYEAYASLAISIGQFFPQFQQLQASHSYTSLSENTATSPPITSFHDYLFNFLVSWEIDLWGKFRHNIEASKAGIYGSIYTYRDVLRSLIGNIAQLYMQILGFNQKIALLKVNLAAQERTVKIVETKFQLGQTSGLDLQQALSVLNSTRATLEAQILQKQLAEHLLCTLLGFAPFDIHARYDLNSYVPLPPHPPCMGIPVDLIRSRPDIRAREQVAITRANIVGIAETELLPSFSLSGLFGWEAEKAKTLFNTSSQIGGYSQDIAWNILNYGRLSNNVRFQNALLQEALVDYQKTVINACREVEDAISSYLQNRKIVEDLDKTVESTAYSLDLSTTQYEYGAVEFINVLTAQTNLVQQEIALVDAKIAYSNSYITLQVSLGKGWEFKDGLDYISPCTKKDMKDRIPWINWMW